MTQPERGRADPAPPCLPHVRVTSACTDAAELRRQLGVRDLRAVSAVSLSAEPEAAAALSWALQQLPRLQQLRLRRAPLPGGLRAFGSGLFQLRVLWLVGCGLETLDGVCALPRLQELYVATNQLTDVSVCSCLDQLQVLDVEDNQLTTLTSCLFLRACSELRSLNLLGNPVCADSGQLQELADWLPQLQTLNGQLTAGGERLLRRLERPAQQQLPPVADGGGRRASVTAETAAAAAAAAGAGPLQGVRRRQSVDAQSAASSLSRLSTSSGSSLPASSLSRPTSSSSSSSPRQTVFSGSSTSPRLPAIDGVRRPAGEPTDAGAGGERRTATVSQVKINTWMAEVAAGKTPPVDRHLASQCK